MDTNYQRFGLNALTVSAYQFAWLHFLKEKVNWFSQLSLASSGVTWKRAAYTKISKELITV